MLGFFILSLIACVYWLSPDSENTSPQPNQDEAKSLVATSQSTLNSSLNENTYLSKSQQDTQVNCQLKIDSSQHLVVNSQTRDCFEYFITQYGESNLQQVKTHFKKFIQDQYLEPARSQIIDLWTRYLKYREQLAQIQPPQSKKTRSKLFSKDLQLNSRYKKTFLLCL